MVITSRNCSTTSESAEDIMDSNYMGILLATPLPILRTLGPGFTQDYLAVGWVTRGIHTRSSSNTLSHGVFTKQGPPRFPRCPSKYSDACFIHPSNERTVLRPRKFTREFLLGCGFCFSGQPLQKGTVLRHWKFTREFLRLRRLFFRTASTKGYSFETPEIHQRVS